MLFSATDIVVTFFCSKRYQILAYVYALDLRVLMNSYLLSKTICQDSSQGKHMVIGLKDVYSFGKDQMCVPQGAKHNTYLTRL